MNWVNSFVRVIVIQLWINKKFICFFGNQQCIISLSYMLTDKIMIMIMIIIIGIFPIVQGIPGEDGPMGMMGDPGCNGTKVSSI